MKVISSLLAVCVALQTPCAFAAESTPPEVTRTTTTRSWKTTIGLSAMGLSLIFAGSGIGAMLHANDANTLANSFERLTEEQAPSKRALLDQRDSAQTLAIAMFVTAGALLAAGITFVLLDTPSPVTITPGAGGFVVQTRF